ncbi:hypothetical protein [Plantibacter sp. YIM 135249]|uniref:hypothetical protein n=1 Tax=Plantibacter sp. YIM 135249 TaxID=3423918 RepID=UPI003D341579
MPTISYGTTTITPDLLTIPDERHDSRNVIHEILDRSDPDVTLHAGATRAGVLELFFRSEADAAAAVTLHNKPGVFVLDYPGRPTWAMRYVTTNAVDRAIDDSTRNHWTVKVPFRQVLA